MRRLLPSFALAALLAAGFSAPAAAQAQSPYIGEIALVPYTFCPAGWAEANGQLLPISQNDALFALYGTTHKPWHSQRTCRPAHCWGCCC